MPASSETFPKDPAFVVVGHFSKPHGTKGELYIWPLTDRPDKTFQPGITLLVSDLDGRAPDPDFMPVLLTGVRPYRKGFLVLLEGVEDRDAADRLRDRYLMRPFAETEPLEEGELFYHQLLGMRVLTVEGVELGRVRELYDLRPASLIEVVGSEKSRLIPFTREVIREVDRETGRIVIDPPAGLLDL